MAVFVFLQKINSSVQTAYLTEASDVEITTRWTDGYLLKDFYSIPHMIHALGGHWWDAEDIELTQEKIETAHKLGLKAMALS